MATTKTTTPKTKTEITLPDDGADAKIVERVDGKTVTYEAKVKQHEVTETDNEATGDISYQDIMEFDFSDVKETPKTPLEKMFELIRLAVERDGEPDNFFASVMRQADPINARNNYPCSVAMDLGSFQFRSTDMFGFSHALQQLNHNSGGVFNVNIYTNEQRPLEVFYKPKGSSPHAGGKLPVGLRGYAVPNPIKDDTTTGNPANAQTDLMQFLINAQEKADQRFETFLREMNKPKEQSTLEKALEQKLINDLVNPPAPQTSQLETTLATMFAMPVMVEKMASKMFPEPATPAEPTALDTVTKVLEVPAVANLLSAGGEIAEAWAVNRIQNAAQPPQQQNGTTQAQAQAQYVEQATEPNEMQELIEDLIEELESENPLDGTNEFINELNDDYPNQAAQLKQTCKIMSFDQVVQTLGVMTQAMQPHPLIPFLDMEQTQAQGKFIWNERGTKVIVRLEEFYNYVKTVE